MKIGTRIFFPAVVASILLVGCGGDSSDYNTTSASSSLETSSASSSSSSSEAITYDIYPEEECDDEAAKGVTVDGKAAICSDGHWKLDKTAAAPILPSPPVFTTETVVNVYENSTMVIDVNVSDATPNVTFKIAKGDDNESFEINATTGELSFMTAPDFETRQNYAVNVSARDNAGNGAIQGLSIIVLDVEENGL